MDVSTIIVSYNTREMTKACLRSVLDRTTGVDMEILLVDNASVDGSAAMVRESFPQVRLIENDRNLGFGAANNVAIRRAQGKYVFLLNPDTLLLNNCVRMFYDFMEDSRNHRVGAIGAELLDDRLRVRHSGGRFIGFWDADYGLDVLDMVPAKLRRGFKSILGPRLSARLATSLPRPGSGEPSVRKGQATSGDPWTSKPVDWVIGADLFMRKQVLDEIGIFDERYFLYAEDADLQYRMSRAGYQRFLIAGPRIVHLEAQSIDPARRRIQLETANLVFLRKYFPLKYAAFRLARGRRTP